MNDYVRRNGFALHLVTAAAEEPITSDEAKAQLRIDTDDDDTYIDALIASARAYVESYLGVRLVTQTWDIVRDDFPVGDREIAIPYGPLQSITYIKYIDTSGVLTTFSAASYVLDTYAIAPKVYPAFSLIWPPARYIQNAVTIRAVVGYGLPSSVPTAIPTTIKHALKLLVAHWYEQRQPVAENQQFEVPLTVKALLDSERVSWL